MKRATGQTRRQAPPIIDNRLPFLSTLSFRQNTRKCRKREKARTFAYRIHARVEMSLLLLEFVCGVSSEEETFQKEEAKY